jgi:hypothetical protein
MNRMNSLSELFKIAMGMADQSQQGQFRTGAYKWENPSGARATIGSLGQSLFPLLLPQGGSKLPTATPAYNDPDAWKGWPQ